ncbi:hypothetical protein HanPI659440_Chr10g0401191 [Helianthus annuus]|nr:hypothetical protein HanPI659440_Chr10g0401191 [Helianthus annuus]
MDGGGRGGVYNPRTVEEVYRDFQGRRNGLIKALTTDVERFYRQCDPGMFCAYVILIELCICFYCSKVWLCIFKTISF